MPWSHLSADDWGFLGFMAALLGLGAVAIAGLVLIGRSSTRGQR